MGEWLHGYRNARPLQRPITVTASFGPTATAGYQDIAGSAKQDPTLPDVVSELAQFDTAVIVLVVRAASVSASQTYDIYITGGIEKCGNGTLIQITQANPLRWDVAHFPQISSTVTAGTPTIYAAKVNGIILPELVSTATLTTDNAILNISAPSANQGVKTLAASVVRHGYWGDHLTHELVCAGGGPYSITYELWLAVAAV